MVELEDTVSGVTFSFSFASSASRFRSGLSNLPWCRTEVVETILVEVVHICGRVKLVVHTCEVNWAVRGTVILNLEAGACLESEGRLRKTVRGACIRSMLTGC
jgi:hypothetical protein